LSAEILQHYPDAHIIKHAEGKGIFDVALEGVKLYSKYEKGLFPETGEVIRLMQKRLEG
jgi:hypothetical protein